MGDQIPFKGLMPNRKRVQRKIVFYHNYFRSSVIPRASNMLMMVCQILSIVFMDLLRINFGI